MIVTKMVAKSPVNYTVCFDNWNPSFHSSLVCKALGVGPALSTYIADVGLGPYVKLNSTYSGSLLNSLHTTESCVSGHAIRVVCETKGNSRTAYMFSRLFSLLR